MLAARRVTIAIEPKDLQLSMTISIELRDYQFCDVSTLEVFTFAMIIGNPSNTIPQQNMQCDKKVHTNRFFW